MPTLENRIDAEFYRLVHQLTDSSRHDARHERRGPPRRAFTSTQRIAPRRGPGLPAESNFFEVQCHDLSQTGFSFLLPHRPDFESLVVAFDAPSNEIYLSASISHCCDVLVHRSGLIEPADAAAPDTGRHARDRSAPTPMIQVGCRFTRRFHRPKTGTS